MRISRVVPACLLAGVTMVPIAIAGGASATSPSPQPSPTASPAAAPTPSPSVDVQPAPVPEPSTTPSPTSDPTPSSDPSPETLPVRRAYLRVTPGRGAYVGGTALVFKGNIGARGKRRVRIQSSQRAGAPWEDLQLPRRRTKANGSFRFKVPAPSMWGIRFRVAGKGGHATPLWTAAARAQEVLLEVQSNEVYLGENRVVTNRPFTIVADTRPPFSGFKVFPPPLMPGRTVSLQRLVGSSWTTIDSTTVDSRGKARFSVTETAEGVQTYRARMEDYTRNGSSVGWFPGFPTRVEVFTTREDAPPLPNEPRKTFINVAEHKGGDQDKAARTYKWRAEEYDYGWMFGEDLDSRPYGPERGGRWVETTAGTGRFSLRNGGLLYMSSDYPGGYGHGGWGDTSIEMRGHDRAYGRWELRAQPTANQRALSDYTIKIELVPSNQSDYQCASEAITLAEMRPLQDRVGFGVRNGSAGMEWTRTKSLRVNGQHHAYAVEISKGHISWFIDGKVVGTVKDPRALTGTPMKLRISSEGEGELHYMNNTKMLVDWVHGYDLEHGALTRSGGALNRSSYTAPC